MSLSMELQCNIKEATKKKNRLLLITFLWTKFVCESRKKKEEKKATKVAQKDKKSFQFKIIAKKCFDRLSCGRTNSNNNSTKNTQ